MATCQVQGSRAILRPACRSILVYTCPLVLTFTIVHSRPKPNYSYINVVRLRVAYYSPLLYSIPAFHNVEVSLLCL